ncbi:PREDICTED: uncharacterized protein LOC108750898 isoform X2 [Trachymyrmex septentrionalis]|uniref:uncharacterized protein LOC108750898 isoform X2 n=1 Tax=Trachymyrmex septentrionalis TaxID=34720 RepID=UPI00084F10B0|nr:PREDICTED: uncharacterized protein LOC108750898 isoform X2 [Trachymyrmex septentrionalis]
MPKLAIHSTVWILTLLFCLTVTENKTYPDFREDKVTHNSSESFWKERPLRGNKSLEIVRSGFPNKTLRFRAAGDINLEGYRNASLNTRTLMDFNDPIIIEDLDDMNDQNLRRTDETSIFSDSTLKASHSEYENQSDTIVDAMVPHSRHKRGILSENGHRRKRVKGNIGHSKHNVETKSKNKKHNALKSPNQLVTKKTKSPNLKKRKKNTQKIGMPAKAIDKSRKIEKRESESSDFDNNIDSVNEQSEALINQKEDASLINRSLVEQRQENAVILPFVHTGKAELHVRIEKIPTNKSSFINSNLWTDHSTGTSPNSIMLPKYNISDNILNVNPNVAPNFDSVEKKKTNNALLVNITLKKQDLGNVSDQETSDSENTSSYNAEVEMGAHPVESNMPRIENRNTKNEKYDHMNEMSVELSGEDAKLRAKRNQEVMSKYLRNDKNSKESALFKHDSEEGIGDTKNEKTRHRRTRDNRAVRSIEEIKELAEKLIAKINELQVYVSNRSETLYNSRKERDSCKNAKRAIKEEPKSTMKKKDISSSTSKIAENTDNRQRFAKEAILVGKRTSQMRSNGSRFARGEYRTRRKSRRKWGRWMDWSSCSVTCGKGRQIRWRHCLHDCNDAETEMEEKACQLPACPPSKFLGIF